jgi:hypothetical protein
MTLKQLILIVLLASPALTQCNQGCLTCSPGGLCVLCDSSLGLVVNKGTCTLSKAINCETVGADDICLDCQTKFFLDPTTLTCVAIPNADLVVNCNKQNAPKVCITCDLGYALDTKGRCEFVGSAIPNCARHYVGSICLECEPGFILNFDRSSCLITPSPNCAVLSNYKCSRCQGGYVLDFFGKVSTAVETTTNAQNLNSALNSGTTTSMMLSNCFTIPNCAEYVPGTTTCKRCAAGFYYSPASKTCVANPVAPPIDFCQKFTSPTVCSKCLDGYILVNAKTCTKFSKVSACEGVPPLESTTATTSSQGTQAPYTDAAGTVFNCQKCTDLAFLTAPNTCKFRTNYPITNCLTYVQNADQCQTCAKGFLKSPDSVVCAAEIPNCPQSQYDPETQTAKCPSCATGYYYIPQTVECVKGTVVGCVTFLPEADRCAVCRDGFKLEPTSGQCLITKRGCLTYKEGSTVCESCANGFVMYNEVCVTAVTYCSKFDTTNDKCLACAGKFLLKNGICVGTVASCSDYDSLGNCVVCNYSYTLKSGTCVYSLANCLENVKGVCTACSPNYTLQLSDNLCYPTLTGCLTYGLTGCAVCKDTYMKNGNMCCLVSLNCVQFTTTTSCSCYLCTPLFRSEFGICVQKPPITGCDVYSATDVNSCQTCYPQYFSTTVTQGCTLATSITGCTTYTTATTCSACADGYSLASDNLSCTRIVNALCAKFLGATCVQCVSGYVFSNGACVEASTLFSMFNCLPFPLTGSYSSDTTQSCLSCNSNSIPVDITNMFTCELESKMSTVNSGPVDPYCASFFLTNGVYKCIKCVPNYVMSNDVCVSKCTSPMAMTPIIAPAMLNAGEFDFTKQFMTNTCFPSSVTDCELSTLSDQQTTTSPAYGCAKCSTNFLAFVNIDAANVLKGDAVSPVDVSPSIVNCNGRVATNILGRSPNTDVNGCQYYTTYPTYNKNACIGCKIGTTGVVRTEIANCQVVTNSLCTRCRDGYCLSANSLSCLPVQANTLCAFYDSSAQCTVCAYCNIDKAYMDTSVTPKVCKARTIIAGCQHYAENEDKCLLCRADTHTLVNGKCYTLLDNCLAHGPLVATPFYECVACDHTRSFIKTTNGVRSCQAVTKINNCEEYSQTSDNVCVTCFKDYILANNECLPFAKAPGKFGFCSSEGTTACTACDFKSLQFTIKDVCVTPAEITNCLVYGSLTTCLQCKSGFYLSAPNACTSIPAATNCKVYVPVDRNSDFQFTASDFYNGAFQFTCHQCNFGYYYVNKTRSITESGVAVTVNYAECVASGAPVDANCMADTLDDGKHRLYDAACWAGCTKNYYPTLFGDIRICVPKTYHELAKANILVTNCAMYRRDTIGGDFRCKKCKSGYFLDNGACLAICPSGSMPALYAYTAGTSAGTYKLSQTNVCLTTSGVTIANCKFVIPAFNLPTTGTATVSYVCGACSDGFTPVTSLNPTATNVFSSVNRFTSISPLAANPETVESVLDVYNEIKECLASGFRIDGISPGTLITNCQEYGKITISGIPTYICNRCKDGYYGLISQDANKAQVLARMSTCTQDPTKFSRTLTYKGYNLGTEILNNFGALRSIFSVDACINPSQTPVAFIGLKTSANFNVEGWYHYMSKTNNPDATLTANKDKSLTWMSSQATAAGAAAPNIQCLSTSQQMSLTTDWVDDAQYTAGLVNNCALYVVNTRGTVNMATTTIDSALKRVLTCVACKPGFAPTLTNYGSESWKYISACSAITNCPIPSKGSVLNVCASCHFQWDPVNFVMDYKTCNLASPISNCFATTSATGNACVLCNPGYVLSADGLKCSPIRGSIGGCDDFDLQDYVSNALSNTARGMAIPTAPDSIIPLFKDRILGGCTECSSSNDVMVYIDKSLESSFLEKACYPTDKPTLVGNPVPTAVANCAIMGWRVDASGNPTVGCVECASGFSIYYDGTAYTCGAVKTYCEVWDSVNSKCLNCQPDSLPVNGVCQLLGSAELLAANCEKWDFTAYATDKTKLVCLTCKIGFYLLSGTCTAITVANCATYDGTACTGCKNGYVWSTVAGTAACHALDLFTTPTSTTMPPHDPSCLILNPTNWNNFELKCSKCANGKFPTTTLPGITNYCYQHKPYVDDTTCALFVTPAATYSAVSTNCQKCQSNKAMYLNANACTARTAASTGVTYAHHYTQTADTPETCHLGYFLTSGACKPATLTPNTGYSPTTVAKTLLPNVMGYIETCSSVVNGCQATTVYKGLIAPLSSIFSCHKCDPATKKIPFAFVHGGGATYTGIKGLFSWGASQTTSLPFNFDDGVSVQCLEPENNSFHPSALAQKWKFPLNCALGIYNVMSAFDASNANLASGVDPAKIAAMCVACKPMYKPTPATNAAGAVVPNMVASCNAIPYCQTSVTFNKCDLCVPGYLFRLGTDGKVDRTVCAAHDLKNCALLKSTGVACAVCASGHFLNLDGVCEPLHLENCQTAVSSQKFDVAFNILEAFFIAPKTGCDTCAATYKPVLDASRTIACLVSDIQNQRSTTSKYAPNCLNYKLEITTSLTAICSICKTGYVITTVKTCVLPDATNTNCKVAVSASQCSVCLDGYLLINNLCQAKAIAYCSTYDLTSLTAQKCLTCEPTYVLATGGAACNVGSIPNCVVYSSATVCQTCAAETVSVTDSNGVLSCVKSPLATNCQSYNPTSFESYTFSCQTCQANSFPSPAPLNYKLCTAISPTVQNCNSYDIQTAFSTSTFKCKGCVTGYTINTSTPPGCTANARRRLASNTLKPVPKTRPATAQSEANPPQSSDEQVQRLLKSMSSARFLQQYLGIKNCIEYDSNVKCIQCVDKMYFDGTACQPLSDKAQVANCLYYSTDSLCIQCSPNFVLKQNICVGVVGKNCLTADDNLLDCLTCPAGYALRTERGVRNCVKLNTPNCVTWANSDPYPCTLCEPRFYVSEGVCAKVNNPVANCLYYSGDGICSDCQTGYTLVLDTTSVTQNIDTTSTKRYDANWANKCVKTSLAISGTLDPFCEAYQLNQNGVCMLCSAGFTLFEGACIQGMIPSGCRVADPKNPFVCMICSSGFYMPTVGSCTPNQSDQASTLSVTLMRIPLLIVSLLLCLLVV